jgi:integrase
MLEEITRTDLLAFKTYLKDKKHQSDRSCWNKFSNVMGFLKWAKIKGLGVSANDWPVYTDREPEDYGKDMLARFFAKCDEVELVWFKYFRFTACREGEVMHVSWPDIDFERKVVTVRENPRFNWRPKKNKEREIPIPTELVDLLVSWKKKSDASCGLVFPTTGCKPKQNFLDDCKAVAKRAKLPTGRRGFHLHKFRAHRTTELARALPTEEAMRITGHTDYESFKRYLAKEKINVLQLQIEAMDAVAVSV